jgi:hypothetical protein
MEKHEIERVTATKYPTKRREKRVGEGLYDPDVGYDLRL